MILRMVLVVAVVAAPVLADVPGPRTVCIAPEGCVACEAFNDACIASAQDAGLVLSDCVSNRGTPTSYVCPPGHPAVASCACSGGSAGVGLLGVIGLLLFSRRRVLNA